MELSHRSLTQIMVLEIRLRHPDAVDFVPDAHAIDSIHFHMVAKKYDTIMYLFGYKFLLGILEMFEECENYEVCSEIKRQIEAHNNMMYKDENRIPTKR